MAFLASRATAYVMAPTPPYTPMGRLTRSAASVVGAPRKKALADLFREQLQGKKVLVRCDLNCPFDASTGAITDDARLRASVPTLRYLLDAGARVAVCSHLGRPAPGGGEDGLDTAASTAAAAAAAGARGRLSLAPCGARLAELLGLKGSGGSGLVMASDCVGPDVCALMDNCGEGRLVLLENTRFHAEEEANDPAFAAQLATPFDMFVNDAFGTAHRAHASTSGVAAHLKPAVAGFLLAKELAYLGAAVLGPSVARPLAAVVGGSKVSSKIGILKALVERCDKVLLGGGMALTFLAAQGLRTGASAVELGQLSIACEVMALAEARGCELLLPSDVVVANAFASDAHLQVVPANAIPDGSIGLDIGPDTCVRFRDALLGCKTAVWNGPMGVFEFERCATGTRAVAEALVEASSRFGAVTVVGGGDTASAVNRMNLSGGMSHVSTGGGAALALLEGKELPSVAALDDA